MCTSLSAGADVEGGRAALSEARERRVARGSKSRLRACWACDIFGVSIGDGVGEGVIVFRYADAFCSVAVVPCKLFVSLSGYE
jgi:hypothetical protein